MHTEYEVRVLEIDVEFIKKKLEEIGAESYEQVDNILQEILAWKWLSSKRGDTYDSIWDMRNAFLEEQQMLDTPIEVIIAVTDRHFKSEFKREQLPIKITRGEIG